MTLCFYFIVLGWSDVICLNVSFDCVYVVHVKNLLSYTEMRAHCICTQ